MDLPVVLGGLAKAVIAPIAQSPRAIATLGWAALRPGKWCKLVRDARGIAVDMHQGGLVVPGESAEEDDVPIRTVIQLDGDVQLKVRPAVLTWDPERRASAFAAHFRELETAIRPLHEAAALRSLLGAALVVAGTGLEVRAAAGWVLGQVDWLSMALGLASWGLALAGPVIFRIYVRAKLKSVLSAF